MDNHHDDIKDIILTNSEPEKRLSRLPVIALAFSFSPVILRLLSFIEIIPLIVIVALLFLFSWHGAVFQFIGIIMGITSISKGKSQIGTIGLIASLVAILFPLVWWYFYFFTYHLEHYF